MLVTHPAQRKFVHPRLKLGKAPHRHDPRTFRLARYLAPDLPPPPPAQDWMGGVGDFGMMGNDEFGDCVFADCGHTFQIVSLNAAQDMISLSTEEVLKYYHWWTGFNPNDPSTDNGAVMLDTFNKWRATNFAGHKLIAFAAVNWLNQTEVEQAISLFGGVSFGLALPQTAADQVGGVWKVVGDPTDAESPSAPGSWGGHAVCTPNYSRSAAVKSCITWGAPQTIEDEFLAVYADECWALFLGYWLIRGPAPSGFRMDALEADLGQLNTSKKGALGAVDRPHLVRA